MSAAADKARRVVDDKRHGVYSEAQRRALHEAIDWLDDKGLFAIDRARRYHCGGTCSTAIAAEYDK